MKIEEGQWRGPAPCLRTTLLLTVNHHLLFILQAADLHLFIFTHGRPPPTAAAARAQRTDAWETKIISENQSHAVRLLALHTQLWGFQTVRLTAFLLIQTFSITGKSLAFRYQFANGINIYRHQQQTTPPTDPPAAHHHVVIQAAPREGATHRWLVVNVLEKVRERVRQERRGVWGEDGDESSYS